MEPLLELTESLHRAGLPGGGALPHLGSELLRVFSSHLNNKTFLVIMEVDIVNFFVMK